MALHITQEEDEIVSGINVTPLVDVAFVVLIIFIVTASLVLKNNIPVDLPKAQTAEESKGGQLNLAITAAGDLYINGKAAVLDDLSAAIEKARRELASSGRRVTAFVSADVKAEYGKFAAVIDGLRLEGVSDIALDTNPIALEEADR